MTRISRRTFVKLAGSTGVALHLLPLSSQASAAPLDNRYRPTSKWLDQNGRPRFRIDGLDKVTGAKVFARDLRAKDMPGWPANQSHVFMLNATRTDRVVEGLDLSQLDDDMQPDRIVLAADLEAQSVAMPEPDFYGQLLLKTGQPAIYLGQPVAILIFHNFPAYHAARRVLKPGGKGIRYGKTVEPVARPPYGGARYVRVGGATPSDDDTFSALQDGTLWASFDDNHEFDWPQPDVKGGVFERGMHFASQIQDDLEQADQNTLVFRRQYASQQVDAAALEGEGGLAWYDRSNATLHLVASTQSPDTVLEQTGAMVAASRHEVAEVFLHAGFCVGYGSKDHHSFPYYVVAAAMFAEGRPVRLALDRFEHFQYALKRHRFEIDNTIAVNRASGKFEVLASNMVADGGGVINFSPSVGSVAVTALQSVYYFPRSDLQVKSVASSAVPAGSMRGYGTLQSMSSMEMMIDELAQELGIDAIELRQKNLFRSGMKNTQGAIPGGALRTAEILERASSHPMWTDREARKAQFEAANPDKTFGTGFACVQKDFGTGAEAAVAQVEVGRDGRITLRHVAPEIGTGASTAQSMIVQDVLGQAADETEFAVIKWPEMPLNTTNEPYTMSQVEHDRRAVDPTWTPRFTSPSSASNSSYYFSHATREAARLVLRYGLWEAAKHIWSRGIGSGQFGPLAVRFEDARWVRGRLTAGNLEPLPLAQLAATAHDLGLLVGATVHTFNRWAWAEAEFSLQGHDVRLPLDALAIKLGAGQKAQGYQFIPRTAVHYPPTQRSNAAVTYYAPNSMLLELSVHTKTGEVALLNHHSIMECGKQIVPELVSGQLQGGIAMGIGHALHEYLPMGEDGPGDGTWNFDRYRLPRGKDVAVWNQTAEILEPLSETDRPKGIGEVVMIPVVAAIANAVHAAIGERFYTFPITAQNIREALK